MAKRIQVSTDGTTFYTLPGNTGELQNEAGNLNDTIFGQDFASTQTGIIGWTINANGLFKGFPGYVATIKKTGASTATTAEATTHIGATKSYQVTSTAKRVFDRLVQPVVKDGGVVHTTDVESIDYLFGIVTFKSAYTPTGAITVDYHYLPLSVVGCSNDYTLTQTAKANDNTCMDTAQGNNGVRTFEYGLKTVTLELTGIYKAANGFLALLQGRSELVIEINPDGVGLASARGFFKPGTTSQSGNVGDLESEKIMFNLSVPDDTDILVPFSWNIASTSTLNTGIQECITSWEASDLITVKYLSDGTNGQSGDGVITNLTLTGGLEKMSEFTIDFQGSDELTAVP